MINEEDSSFVIWSLTWARDNRIEIVSQIRSILQDMDILIILICSIAKIEMR